MLEEEELKDAALIVFANKQVWQITLATHLADTPVADTPEADTPVADTPVADTLVADTCMLSPAGPADLAPSGCDRGKVGPWFTVRPRIVYFFLHSIRAIPAIPRLTSFSFQYRLSRRKNRAWAIFKTSAIKGDGLFDGLDWLVASLREGNKS